MRSSLTFVASKCCILHRAKPHFVDNAKDLGIDKAKSLSQRDFRD